MGAEHSARKNAFTADGGPHKVARILDVADGLRRIGEFESADMLTAYAERIEADEAAGGRIDFKGMWNDMSDRATTHPPAQAAQVDKPPKLGGCCCGEPCVLGSVHRTDGPCFVYDAPTAEPAQAVEEMKPTLSEFARLPDAERVAIGQAVAERVDELQAPAAEPVAQGEAGVIVKDTVCFGNEHWYRRYSVQGVTFLAPLDDPDNALQVLSLAAQPRAVLDAADSGRAGEALLKKAANMLDRAAELGGNPDLRNARHECAAELREALAAQGHGEVARLQGVIERDRTVFCGLIAGLKRELQTREWLGNENARAAGGYRYDEPGFIREFGEAWTAIMSALNSAHQKFRDFTDCPRDEALRAAQAEAQAILDAPPASPAGVLDGYVLVPRDPNDAMLEAALMLQGEDAALARAPALLSALLKIYRAMLAAAPSAPEGGEA